MRETPPLGDQERGPQTRPFGSSGLAAILGVGVFLIALVIAGVLVLGGDNDDGEAGEFGATGQTASPTTTASTDLQPTETPDSDDPTATSEPATFPTMASGSPTPRTFPTLTPEPTATEDPDAALEPTEPVDEREDSETEEPVDEDPADDDVDEPDTDEEVPPAEDPVAGDFGFLPAPQLPSGGAGQSLSLDYQLATSLELVPLTGTVYQVEWPAYSETDVETMAATLGLDGVVDSQGDGVFSVSGSEASLFVSPTIIEYGAYSAGSGGPLPSSDVAIDAAWSWFAALGVNGVEIGEGNVVAVEEDAGLSIVALTPANPAPNLAPTPSARIKVSAEGVVEEATIVWPSALYGSDYGLRPALDIWEDLRSGNAFVSADVSESGGGSGTMSVTDISIAYTVAGSPWDAQYVVPLVVFGGYANVNGVDVYVSAYVPAIHHQENPLG